MKKPVFITGIGTGVGKTVTSAVWVEKLKADYWKPIQSGDLDYSDTDRVRGLVSNTKSTFHPEAYRLSQPFSPHKSAALDGIDINMDSIIVPQTDRPLVIEGAGGLMVPLNNSAMMIDLIQRLEAKVVLVSRHYLGSINHTLLSLELLKQRGIVLKRLVICGKRDESSEDIFKKHISSELVYIPEFDPLNSSAIRSFAESCRL